MINVSINIDFGNFWSALSALGTVLASSIALWLARKDSRKKLDAVLAWDNTTGFIPTLYVSNSCNKLIVIDEITIKYKRKVVNSYCLRDPHRYFEQSAIYPNTVQKFPLPGLEAFKTDNIDSKKLDQQNILEIELTDNYGKKYCNRQKISDDKLYDLDSSRTFLSDTDN